MTNLIPPTTRPIDLAIIAVRKAARKYVKSGKFRAYPAHITKPCVDCGEKILAGPRQWMKKRCDTCKIIHLQEYQAEYRRTHPVITRKKAGY